MYYWIVLYVFFLCACRILIQIRPTYLLTFIQTLQCRLHRRLSDARSDCKIQYYDGKINSSVEFSRAIRSVNGLFNILKSIVTQLCCWQIYLKLFWDDVFLYSRLVGYMFVFVCWSVCLSVCPSVCLSDCLWRYINTVITTRPTTTTGNLITVVYVVASQQIRANRRRRVQAGSAVEATVACNTRRDGFRLLSVSTLLYGPQHRRCHYQQCWQQVRTASSFSSSSSSSS